MLRSKKNIALSDNEKVLVKNGWGDDVLNSVELQHLTYSSDGYIVEGYAAFPVLRNVKYPLIIWNRGGDELSGRLDDFLAWGILGEIASWGYVVLASQYRDKDQFGGEELNDILNILKIGMQFEEFDGENVGTEGWSRGGMMTYQMLTRVNFMKCAVIVAGLSNIQRNVGINENLNKKINLLKSERKIEEYAAERSAVNFYHKISMDIPLILIHGTHDKKVSYEDSEEMYGLLKKRGKSNIELIPINGGDHYLRKHRKFAAEIRKSRFDKYLKSIN
ncbi:MAG: prolyl oligopeptidase family serine peptidase [Ignavibacteria bacterium]|nr:prolyl oligopeptidase family serine peptidase [Ignavibacteria bacterium]